MIKYVKKIIKKYRLLKKYKKTDEHWKNQLWLETHYNWTRKERIFFQHQFLCELRCYNRLKKL